MKPDFVEMKSGIWINRASVGNIVTGDKGDQCQERYAIKIYSLSDEIVKKRNHYEFGYRTEADRTKILKKLLHGDPPTVSSPKAAPRENEGGIVKTRGIR